MAAETRGRRDGAGGGSAALSTTGHAGGPAAGDTAATRARLRVAFVVTRSDAIGGANVHVRDLAVWLRAQGHEALVACGGRGPFLDLLDQAGVPYRSLPALGRALRPERDTVAAWQLARALRRWRPSVVSLHTAKAGALGRLVAPALGLRPLYTPHGWAFTEGVPPREARRYRALERWLARLPGLIVNVCEHERALALAAGVGRAEQHLVVHNGMPARPELPLARPGHDPARLVMVARFEAPKDHATLLRSLAGVPAAYAWQLALIGDGPGRAATEALAAELGLGPRVRFLGALSDVAAELAQAQALVLITRWEGFPRSILEGMRAGLPVLASAVGGVHEAVLDGVTGFVTAPGDVAANTAALTRLLADPALRERLGEAGRARYLERFTFERMACATLPLYRRVARPAEPGRAASAPHRHENGGDEHHQVPGPRP